jgi:hypothetical protein
MKLTCASHSSAPTAMSVRHVAAIDGPKTAIWSRQCRRAVCRGSGTVSLVVATPRMRPSAVIAGTTGTRRDKPGSRV